METREMTPVDVWKEKVQQDINELKNNHGLFKNEQDKMKTDIQDLKMSDKLQDNEISNLKATLTEIKDDTSWIRRKITGALITAAITAIVGGVIGVAIANIF